MRLAIVGGPHDGAHAIIPEHTVQHGKTLMVGATRYVIDWQRETGPRLASAGVRTP